MTELPRNEHLRSLVMDAIANDYEDFSMIKQEVLQWALEEGPDAITDVELQSTLLELIKSGLAKVRYFGEVPSGEAVSLDPPPFYDCYCYFKATDAGKAWLVSEVMRPTNNQTGTP